MSSKLAVFAEKFKWISRACTFYFEGAFIAEFCPVIKLRAEIIREQKVAASHFAPPCVNNHNLEIQSQAGM